MIDSYIISKGYRKVIIDGGIRYTKGNYDIDVYIEDGVTSYCYFYKSMSGLCTTDFNEVCRSMLYGEEDYKLFIRSETIKNILNR